MTDAQLLEQFIATGSQPAFAALVERHVGWVAAVARRRVRDPHLADDVTQAVFILLAQKAKSLKRETVLSAWLFQATRYSSMAVLRAERRRQRREQRAADIMRQQSSSEEDLAERWEHQLAPELDELVAKLSGVDRRAVLLRFYEQKTFVEVGEALGVSEDAARKRVTRAVEKLSTLFRRRGVTVSAVMLTTAMAAHVAPAAAAAAAATAGIAATTAAAALSTASAPLAASAAAKSAAGLLAWAQIKAAAAVVVIATTVAAVGGGTTMAVIAQTRNTAPPASPATPPATQSAIAAVTVPATAPATAPSRILTGRVVTPQEQPVEGARVHLLGETDLDGASRIVASAESVADGVYRIPAPQSGEPIGPILIDAPPWAYTTARLAYNPGYIAVLQPASEVEVTVLGPDGKPAANVPIAPEYASGGHLALAGSFWSISFPPQFQQQIAQRTDAAGKVRFTRLPRGASVRLGALDDRFAVATYEDAIVLADAAQTPAAKPFRLAAAVSIAGRVTLPDGAPAADVRIGAQSADHSRSDGWGSTITDAAGNYRIGKLRGPGEYHVAVDTADQRLPEALRGRWTAVAREKLPVGDGQQVSGVDLKLIEGVIVRGRVLGKETREPIKQISVGAYGPAHPRSGGWVQSAQTDERGEWSMRVPPGAHYIYLASSPPAPYVNDPRGGREVNVTADKPTTVDFLLERMKGKPVAGRVVGPDGNGVAGAIINVELEQGHDVFASLQATTDRDGKFVFKSLPPRSQLRAAGSGGMKTLKPLKVNGGEKDVTIKLLPPVKIVLTGRVLDGAGNPVPRAQVGLTVWNGQMGLGTGNVPVDADGRYALKDLDPDKRYTLEAKAPAHGVAQMQAKIELDEKLLANATAKTSVPVEQANLVLKHAGSFVSGIVVGDGGKPVGDIVVRLHGRDTAGQSKRTDANGRFEFADIVDGETISLNAFKDGEHGPETDVPAGSVDVTVTWKEPNK